MGPRDLNVENEDFLGGNYYSVLSFEAGFPLGLPDEYGITGGAFLDFGSVWGLNDVDGGPRGNDPVDDDFHLRSTAGLSIFWTTPFGPLRFNFSAPLIMEDYDEPQYFSFAFQTQF
jgi:outer membrane protein insertion porin family